MRSRIDPSEQLLRMADSQGGTITRAQYLRLGLPESSARRLVARRHWQVLRRGVLFTRPGPVPWAAAAWAAVLVAGPAAALGGDAAAYLHRLGPIEPRLLVTWGRSARAREGRWIVRRDCTGRLGRAAGEPRVIGLEDTVLDLSERASPDRVAGLVATARNRGLDLSVLHELARQRPTLNGRGFLLGLLGSMDGVESPLERRYQRWVEQAHGLPVGRRQVQTAGGRTDVAYELWRTLVELDGRLGHEGAGAFRDMRRDNRNLVAADLSTLRYGWADVATRPCATAVQVATVLRRRGWEGVPHHCDRCAPLRLWPVELIAA